MKLRLLMMTALMAVVSGVAAESVTSTEMGLSKTSVFDTPTPEPFVYPAPEPSQSKILPRAYGGFEGAPPQVPHAIAGFLPLRQGANECANCHDKPHLIGRAPEGSPPPMSRSHYGGFKGEGDKKTLSGASFVCTQCHVPQSGAQPLVANSLE